MAEIEQRELGTGKASEIVALAYEDALKNLRALAQVSMEEKSGQPLSKFSDYLIQYADIGSGRKIELRYDEHDSESQRMSAFSITIGKDPYDLEAVEIKYFLPFSADHASHIHPYSGKERKDSRWRPSEEEMQVIERAIRDFKAGDLATR